MNWDVHKDNQAFQKIIFRKFSTSPLRDNKLNSYLWHKMCYPYLAIRTSWWLMIFRSTMGAFVWTDSAKVRKWGVSFFQKPSKPPFSKPSLTFITTVLLLIMTPLELTTVIGSRRIWWVAGFCWILTRKLCYNFELQELYFHTERSCYIRIVI